jgi:hypothetical protein
MKAGYAAAFSDRFYTRDCEPGAFGKFLYIFGSFPLAFLFVCGNSGDMSDTGMPFM